MANFAFSLYDTGQVHLYPKKIFRPKILRYICFVILFLGFLLAFQCFRKNGFVLISPAYEIFHSNKGYMLKLTTVIFRSRKQPISKNLRNHPDSKFQGIFAARLPRIFLVHSR